MDAALACIQEHRDRLCARLVEKKIGQEMIRDLPDHRYIAANSVFDRHVELQGYREKEHERFAASMTANDVGALIARYPIRETQALGRIALQLNFRTTGKYEMAVRAALVGEEEARNALRELLEA